MDATERKSLPAALCCALLVASALPAAAPKVNLNEAEFRDRVYACWTGKNIGGTLGMPFEGKRELNNVTFYTNLQGGQAAPNDDIDLPLLWLKALEERDGRVDARILGEYWLKYVSCRLERVRRRQGQHEAGLPAAPVRRVQQRPVEELQRGDHPLGAVGLSVPWLPGSGAAARPRGRVRRSRCRRGHARTPLHDRDRQRGLR